MHVICKSCKTYRNEKSKKCLSCQRSVLSGDFSVVELPCLKREKLFFCGNFISGQITWFVVDGKYERVSVMWIFNQNSWNDSALRPTAWIFIYWPPNNLWIFYASPAHVLAGVLLLLLDKSCRFTLLCSVGNCAHILDVWVISGYL